MTMKIHPASWSPKIPAGHVNTNSDTTAIAIIGAGVGGIRIDAESDHCLGGYGQRQPECNQQRALHDFEFATTASALAAAGVQRPAVRLGRRDHTPF